MSFARITPNHKLIQDDNFDGHTLVVPSCCLSFFKIQLPVKTIAQCQKIIAFSLEEELSDDIENLHFSVQLIDNEWFVVVCTHKQMREWLDLCLKHRFVPKKMFPDILLLPKNIDLLIEPDQCLLDLEYQLPIPLKRNITESVLKELAIDTNQLNVFTADNYEEFLEIDFEITKRTVNLLQNQYSTTIAFKTWLKPWLKVAGLGALIWSTYVAHLFIENLSLEQAVSTQKNANLKRFREFFPEEKRIVNIRTQSEQNFRLLEKQKKISNISLIGLIEDIIHSLKKHKNVKIQRIKYRDYSIQLNLTSTSVTEIEKLINNLKQNSQLIVQVQSLGSDKGTSKSTLNIKKTT